VIVATAFVLAIIACIALCLIPPVSASVSLYRAACAASVAGLWLLAVQR
jgi:hypothetical protein